MELDFISSLGFIPKSIEEAKLQQISIAEKSKDFNVKQSYCTSGIFQHTKNKKVFLLLNQSILFIGILGCDGFTKSIKLDSVGIENDYETLKQITKMVVTKYIKQEQ